MAFPGISLWKNKMPVLCSQFTIISTSLPVVLRKGMVENKQFYYFRTVYENFVNFCWLMEEWIHKILVTFLAHGDKYFLCLYCVT